MKYTIRLMIAFVVIAAIVVAAVPTFAQDEQTFTISEADIAGSDLFGGRFAEQRGAQRFLSDLAIDLQPGQVVLSGTLDTIFTGETAVSLTIVPVLEDQRLYWDVVAGTSDGEAIAEEDLAQLNERMDNSRITQFRRELGTGHILDVIITDEDITFVLDAEFEFDGELGGFGERFRDRFRGNE